MGGAGGCHGASLGFEALGAFTVRMLVGALVTFVLVIVISLVAFWQAGCPKGGFQCRDGQCLARSRRCDNEDNCSEREDEEDCMLPGGVDVKKLSFPFSNTAPCHMCVCPSPHSLEECSLPSPPHLSLAHCHLTTSSSSRDAAGIRLPRSAHHRFPYIYAGKARTASKNGRADAGENAAWLEMERHWLAKRKMIGMDGDRAKANETAREILKALALDKKCQGNIRGGKSLTTKQRIEESKNYVQGGRPSHDSRKAHEKVTGGLLYNKKCVPQGNEEHSKSGCRRARSTEGREKTLNPLYLNPLHSTNTLAPGHIDESFLLYKGQVRSLRDPFYPRPRTPHGTYHTHKPRSMSGPDPSDPKEPRKKDEFFLKNTSNRVYNENLISLSRYHALVARPRPDSRMRRQLRTEHAEMNVKRDSDLQPLEHFADVGNTTSMAIPFVNMTLVDEEEEEEEEDVEDLGVDHQLAQGEERTVSQGPEIIARQPDIEVRDSCHCELSNHLTCVGTHLRNVSDRIVGEMKHLTVTSDDALTLEDKVLARYNTLATLSLTSGGLITLPSFVTLTFLEHLYLTGNMIKTVEAENCVGLDALKVFFINRNRLTYIDLTCFQHTTALQDLNMGHNRLTLEGQSFPRLAHLTSLYLDNNFLTSITKTLLTRLVAIRTLDLRDNQISTVHSKAFTSLTHLRLLMMSGNRVTSVAGLFQGLNNLAMLKLEELDLHDIHTKNFHILPGLKFVYFDTFRYCRYVPTIAICLPNFDGVTSTEDLLGWRTLRVAVWLMALLTLTTNVVVIFCRAISRKDNKILKLFIKNLAFADLLMGVYLVVIGVQDAITRGRFNSHALQWADSYTCIFAGVLAMVSSESSVFILSFMSLERYLYISEAFHDRTLSLRGARLCLAAIWLTSVSLAFFPILWIRSFYGNNSVCFPLYINEPYLAGWQYSAFIFLGLNFVSMLVILGSYVGLFLNIRGTRLSTSRSSDEMNFAFRFFFIVVTNCLCWLPIMCLKVAALAHVEVHQGVYAWLVVLVLPINSAVNPALYTFSTSQFQLQMTSAVTTFRRLHQRHNSDTEALRHSSTRTGPSHPHYLHAPPPAPLPATTNPVLVDVRDIRLKTLPSPAAVESGASRHGGWDNTPNPRGSPPVPPPPVTGVLRRAPRYPAVQRDSEHLTTTTTGAVVLLSPREMRNGLLLNLKEAATVPEELPPRDDGDGDDTCDAR